MLTDLRSILALAEEKGCAIPAFNCYTQECVMGVLEAAKETGAPVIFQMFSRLADTNDGNFVPPAILAAIRQLPQPAVMHLDHGAGIPEVVRAIRLGMTGVMIDASTLPLEENIATTKFAAELCSYAGVPVEGELGHVGATKDEVLGNYTDVAEAERFVKETGVSALDIAKGLLDNGIHPPTMYFPLIVHGALMVEPTETESKATMDEAIEVFRSLARLAYENPEALHTAPHNTPVRRLDEVQAARNPVLRAALAE